MLISIVTVCFNNILGLEKTFYSVLNQKDTNFELIVIDGGSNDGTLQYLQGISDPRVKFVSEPDNGIFDAMNKGISLSSGDFISFMNSGDVFFCNNTISEVFSKISDPLNFSVIYGNKIFDGQIIYPTDVKTETESGGMFACHQSMFFRNIKLRYDDKLKIYGDYGLLASIFTSYGIEAFYYVDIPICIYEGSGISNRITFTKRKEKFVLVFKYFGLTGLAKSYLLRKFFK